MNILIIFLAGFLFGKYIEPIIETIVQLINYGFGAICVKFKYQIEKTHYEIENIGKDSTKNPIGFSADEE